MKHKKLHPVDLDAKEMAEEQHEELAEEAAEFEELFDAED